MMLMLLVGAITGAQAADTYTVTANAKASTATAGQATVTFLLEQTTPTDSSYFAIGKFSDYTQEDGIITLSKDGTAATGYATVKAEKKGSIVLNLRHLKGPGSSKYFYIVRASDMAGITNFTIGGGDENGSVKNGGVTFKSPSAYTDYTVTFTAEKGVTYYVGATTNNGWGFRGFEYTESTDYDAETTDAGSGVSQWKITEAGNYTGGETIEALPGLDFSFGAATDGATYAAGYLTYSKGNKRSENLLFIGSSETKLTNGVPTAGNFLTLQPYVNGNLNVTYFGWGGQTYVIYDADAGATVYSGKQSDHGDATTGNVVLLAGHTYYMYHQDGGSSYGLHVNAITYEPIYLMLSTYKVENNLASGDDKDGATLTMTLGSEGFEVPKAVTTAHSGVTFDINTSTDGLKVEDNGTLVIPSDGGTGTITCTVTRGLITQTISYTLTVDANHNAWMVHEGDDYSVGDQVAPQNGGCTMTFGGWKYNSGSYDDDYSTVGGTGTTDDWEKAHFDDAGNDEYGQPTLTVDGFRYASSGKANGKAETKSVNEANFTLNNDDYHATSQLPCRGAYVVFEPTKDGTLTVYLLQNGCIDTYQKDKTDDDGNVTGKRGMPTGHISFRTFMIADEQGNLIDATGSATATYQYGVDDIGLDNAEWGANITDESAIRKLIEDNVTKGGAVKVLEAATGLGGGYYVLRKSYTKYVFQVTAGKSYYVFSNWSKLGICGFQFVAEEGQEATAVSLANAETSYTYQDKGLCNVTLQDRTFTKDNWTSLCLPFSYSTSAMKKLFGDEVQLIEFTGTINGDRAQFVNHVNNQLVVAGRPYFIKPGKTVQNPTFENVTFENVENGEFGEAAGYVFRGVYNTETMPKGSNFVNGKLYYTTKEMDSNAFRAYFEKIDASAANLAGVITDNGADDQGDELEATGIEQAMAESLGADRNATGEEAIYDLSGRRVQSAAAGKGVYIVNGKKVVVD